jgi:oligoendopeptidase F
MSALEELMRKPTGEMNHVEYCLFLLAGDPDFGRNAEEAATELAALEKERNTLARMLRQTARHMHGTARARSYDMHTSADFDTCSNGWCKEAAAALKGA